MNVEKRREGEGVGGGEGVTVTAFTPSFVGGFGTLVRWFFGALVWWCIDVVLPRVLRNIFRNIYDLL